MACVYLCLIVNFFYRPTLTMILFKQSIQLWHRDRPILTAYNVHNTGILNPDDGKLRIGRSVVRKSKTVKQNALVGVMKSKL